MKGGIAAAAVVIALLGWVAPAAAQVKLEFKNGLVSLSAQNAPIRSILAEWARVGGTRIINGDRVTGAPVTLELTGVTERQAMEVLLRNTAGYIVAARNDAALNNAALNSAAVNSAARQAGMSTASSFASIVILPTSAAAGRQVASVQTPVRAVRPPDPKPDPDPEEDPVTDTAPDADDRVQNARQAAEEAARQRIADRRQQIFVGDQTIETQTPDGRPAPATAGNPFGLPPGAARPGVITAPPPQQPNTRGRQPDPEP